MKKKPDKPEHGTYNRYRYWGCTCTACRAVNAALQRKWKLDHLTEEIPPEYHGYYSTYINRHCRCDACTEAMLVYDRDYRRRKREGNRTDS